MSVFSFPTWDKLPRLGGRLPFVRRPLSHRYNLNELAGMDTSRLPRFVQESAVAMKYLRLLGMLDWSHFPERPDQRFSPEQPPMPLAPFVAAYLVKLDQHIPYVADLRAYLVQNPALVWVLGFPLKPSRAYSWGFDVDASLPCHRHLSRLLRSISNAALQYLLDETVRLAGDWLKGKCDSFADCVSVDTKHIIAWVKENNPKAYIKEDRYCKDKQPTGDPDCKLGCKRKHNKGGKPERIDQQPAQPTPKTNPGPANSIEIGEFYWGYGSGVVATKTDDWGDFVLAELTLPFDQADVSYFLPLMDMVEHRLGCKPHFGALDAAFDAFYVYEYFHNAGGFAAVPLVQRGAYPKREFTDDGLPICAAGLPMAFLHSFQCKTARIPHQRSRYGCPLFHPQPDGQLCPKQHKNWPKGGCITTMADCPGARLRYQLDRSAKEYKNVFRQRTATERINSQAVAFGIERPKLRNAISIANHNTLTYVLINLHALQRLRQRLDRRSPA